MKKYYILLFLLGTLFSSCEDYLAEESQDLIVPKSGQDLKELLYYEAYWNSIDHVNSYLDVMTDDAEDHLKRWGFGGDKRIKVKGYYTWQQKPEFIEDGSVVNDNAWSEYYHDILIANIVLNEVNSVSVDPAEADDIRAEALFIRAYSYFMLLNLYGEPFDAATAETALGVPINLDHSVKEKQYTRASVANVYAQINEDIETAIELFESCGIEKTIYRISKNAAKVLACRSYLFQNNQAKVMQYATEVINELPALEDLNRANSELTFYNFNNPEIIYSYGLFDSYRYQFSSLAKARFVASSELIDMYTSNDLRKKFYFAASSGRYLPGKSSFNSVGVFGKAIRNVEAYLCRAEVHALQGAVQKALDDLNYIRSYRFSADHELTADATTILQLVRDERRRELSLEEIRWFDLRRYGCPEITHTYTDYTTKEVTTFVLPEKDPAYTLPVPNEVLKYTPSLKDIDRPERPPVE
jgi:hypothetical protein